MHTTLTLGKMAKGKNKNYKAMVKFNSDRIYDNIAKLLLRFRHKMHDIPYAYRAGEEM